MKFKFIILSSLTDSSVCIMLLYPIWSLSPGSGLVVLFYNLKYLPPPGWNPETAPAAMKEKWGDASKVWASAGKVWANASKMPKT